MLHHALWNILVLASMNISMAGRLHFVANRNAISSLVNRDGFALRRSSSFRWKSSADGRNAAFLSVVGHFYGPRPYIQTPISKHALFASKNATPSPIASYHSTANQQIVARRNEINRQKREARQKALEKDRERNLKLRHLFSDEIQQRLVSDSDKVKGNDVPPMFAVKVVTCRTLRTELKMNGREKRGRMFVERPPFFADDRRKNMDYDDANNYACMSVKALKQTIHEFFRRLKKSTYVLSASLPVLDQEGNVLMYDDDESEDEDRQMSGTWTLETDEDVQHAFFEAEQFFWRHQKQRQQSDTSAMKRPTLILHVTKDPNAPLPPPPPPYLENLPDPNASPTMTMLSFYSFPPDEGIADPDSTAEQLMRLWRPFRALGRVYVAKEGVNAQMAVPTNVIPNFLKCCTLSSDQGGELSHVLGTYMENGINIDPVPVPMNEFRQNPAFRNLHIRVRSQIVADGFDKPLDWQSAGYDMPPLEWHAKLKEAREKSRAATSEGDTSSADPLPIVFDCRNSYETQVGKFELAEPLQTDNFRDSWDVLRERLKDTPKDTPIMTYCTGGIRCVKVNAYLTQELEFTNVSRLAGGIIGYDRTLNEQAPTEEPMFKGVNYVFDGRMGRRITDDQLGTCFTCGSKTHLITNCKNENCHKRMVQCENCRDSFFGTCSEGCKTRVVHSAAASDSVSNAKQGQKRKGPDVEINNLGDYSSGYSSPAPPLLHEIELNTAALIPTGAHMVSGAMQGRFLTMLASMTREGRILEIGTFTGYATACFLEGSAIAGKLSGCQRIGSRGDGGPYVLSLERDRRALGVAAAHMKVMSEHGMNDHAAGNAAKLRATDKGVGDFEGESVTFEYNKIALCELLRVSDALATLEEMASGSPSIPTAPFDIAFVDADKTRLMEYVDVLVSGDDILKKGGLIVVDNVMWKGLVLDASGDVNDGGSSDDEYPLEPRESLLNTEKDILRKNRRARKLANKIHRFNSAVLQDDRVEVLMMPIRDGLSLIRKL
ncbi:hypothetical protein ACHAWX_006361 [Stephanocyclus meneghinianus]